MKEVSLIACWRKRQRESRIERERERDSSQARRCLQFVDGGVPSGSALVIAKQKKLPAKEHNLLFLSHGETFSKEAGVASW